jgi:SAM-dependent methyltransferase
VTSIKRLYWILHTQLGIDPRKTLRSLQGLTRYVNDFFRFRAHYRGSIEFVPCLQDWHEEGGATKNEYFWQDLLVARKIFEAKPEIHVDIGSRVDGFVSHVASFRNIEVLDVRPIAARIPGVSFRQADLMSPVLDMRHYCDSLSCLHALEHFGLGRYGDPVRHNGHQQGLANMATLLREGGRFYLSVPIGIERVEFNANRVFDPRTIVKIAVGYDLVLIELMVVHSGGELCAVRINESTLADWAEQKYALGIFIFEKRTKK